MLKEAPVSLDGLQLNTLYEVQLAVSSSAGTGPWSSSFSYQSRLPTGNPESVQVARYSSSYVVITWAEPIPIAGVTFTGYRVLMDQLDGRNWTTVATLGMDKHNYTVQGLRAGARYKFAVASTTATSNAAARLLASDDFFALSVLGEIVTPHESWMEVLEKGDGQLSYGTCKCICNAESFDWLVPAGPYAANALVGWWIRTPIATQRITLAFSQFALECNHDSLVVSSADDQELWRGGCSRAPFTLRFAENEVLNSWLHRCKVS